MSQWSGALADPLPWRLVVLHWGDWGVVVQVGAEDVVPEPGGDAEGELVVLVVMLEVELLELAHELRHLGVVEPVVALVVVDVAEEATGEAGVRPVERQ